MGSIIMPFHSITDSQSKGSPRIAELSVARWHPSTVTVGIEIPIVGKPARELFRAAVVDLAANLNEAVIVGDDIGSDVRGGQAVGTTGVLVGTRNIVPAIWKRGAQRPTT